MGIRERLADRIRRLPTEPGDNLAPTRGGLVRAGDGSLLKGQRFQNTKIRAGDNVQFWDCQFVECDLSGLRWSMIRFSVLVRCDWPEGRMEPHADDYPDGQGGNNFVDARSRETFEPNEGIHASERSTVSVDPAHGYESASR